MGSIFLLFQYKKYLVPVPLTLFLTIIIKYSFKPVVIFNFAIIIMIKIIKALLIVSSTKYAELILVTLYHFLYIHIIIYQEPEYVLIQQPKITILTNPMNVKYNKVIVITFSNDSTDQGGLIELIFILEISSQTSWAILHKIINNLN